MKSVKKIYKCTDCSTGPCFAIVPVETSPEYCSVEIEIIGKDEDNDARVEPVNWLQEETIYRDKGFSPEILKEILDA